MRRTEAWPFLVPNSEESRYLLEGPRLATVDSAEVLIWVNIQSGESAKSGSIFAYHTQEPNDTFRFECQGRPGFVLPVADGDFVFAGVEKSLQLCYLGRIAYEAAPRATIPDDNPRTIINDAEIVPGGKAIVFGTKDVQFKERIANLYLYTVDDNRVSLLADGQTCSNGKVFAADARGLILYDIDTPTRTVVRYRLDVVARTAKPDGVALDLGCEVGFPDGMCDCGDGTVIIAFYNPDFAEAGRAVRFNLVTGKAVEEWTTSGSPRVTCPLLVKRPDGVKLILTTATEGMPSDMRARCPNAGCLFIADTQLSSCPEAEVVHLPS